MLALGGFALAAFPAAQTAAAPAPAGRRAPVLGPQGQAQEVDVALVLAVDVSGSIDYEEAELQRKASSMPS